MRNLDFKIKRRVLLSNRFKVNLNYSSQQKILIQHIETWNPTNGGAGSLMDKVSNQHN